jgi:hypothetical protein
MAFLHVLQASGQAGSYIISASFSSFSSTPDQVLTPPLRRSLRASTSGPAVREHTGVAHGHPVAIAHAPTRHGHVCSQFASPLHQTLHDNMPQKHLVHHLSAFVVVAVVRSGVAVEVAFFILLAVSQKELRE